jgi:UDP:flavonoid glycosyltransferase YjiC (YdhE family)
MTPSVDERRRDGGRRRVLFCSEDVTLAQVVRLSELARRLAPDDYEVHFACAGFDEMVFAGARFHRHPLRTIDRAVAMRALARGQRLYERSVLEAYVEEERVLLDEVRPDVVVGDFRLSLSVSTALAKVPYLSLINAYWSPHAVRSEWPLPDHPIVDLLGDDMAGRYYGKALPHAMKYFAAPVNSVRRRYGLPALGSLLDVLCFGDVTLHPDAPELVPTRGGPASHVFLGPVQWSPPVPVPQSWQHLDERLPTVYVTLGSSGRVDRLPMVLEALDGLLVNVIVATAGRSDVAAGPRRFVDPFVPGDLAARRASVVISNGGSTTGYQALAEGVPVLGVASNLDQCLAMQVIERFGAGLTVRAGAATPEAIVAAVRRLTEERGFREAASRAAEAFARHDPHARFAECLGAVFGSVRAA